MVVEPRKRRLVALIAHRQHPHGLFTDIWLLVPGHALEIFSRLPTTIGAGAVRAQRFFRLTSCQDVGLAQHGLITKRAPNWITKNFEHPVQSSS